jgi:hypothetical protein
MNFRGSRASRSCSLESMAAAWGAGRGSVRRSMWILVVEISLQVRFNGAS